MTTYRPIALVLVLLLAGCVPSGASQVAGVDAAWDCDEGFAEECVVTLQAADTPTPYPTYTPAPTPEPAASEPYTLTLTIQDGVIIRINGEPVGAQPLVTLLECTVEPVCEGG